MQILLEQREDNELWSGFSETYIRFSVKGIDIEVHAGDLVTCQIESLSGGAGYALFLRKSEEM